MLSTPRTRTPRQAQTQRDVYGNPTIFKKRQSDQKHVPLTEEQLLLCAPYVRGFLLRRKEWGKFCVDGIRDIAWNEEAFESLVLPNNEKDLLLAFAEGQANGNAKFDDFIQGKGKGIIMLLSGAPGVGKTLTAESVAETMRVPLYVMSAGELGTYSENLERVLKDVLDKCAMWKAILLLDEADVFLEARSTSDLQRNAMVSGTFPSLTKLTKPISTIMLNGPTHSLPPPPRILRRHHVPHHQPRRSLRSRVRVPHRRGLQLRSPLPSLPPPDLVELPHAASRRGTRYQHGGVGYAGRD